MEIEVNVRIIIVARRSNSWLASLIFGNKLLAMSFTMITLVAVTDDSAFDMNMASNPATINPCSPIGRNS